MENPTFISSIGARFNAEEVAREIVDFMMADTNAEYKVTLGTDSLMGLGATADFVTAIVVHRVGRGGRYFWRRIDLDNMHTMRIRITQEVLISLDIAKDFLNKLQQIAAKNANLPRYDFEIHIDVGENGATKAMIQELVGMIRANNFEARTKPFSYAASNVADRHT